MASQKHQFEQQPPHKNTFTRAKHSRIGVTAPGWSTEVRKDALKRVVKTVSHYPHHPSLKPMKPSMERDSLLMWEEDWSEGPTSEPDPRTRPTPSPGGSYEPRFLACPNTRSSATDTDTRPMPLVSCEYSVPEDPGSMPAKMDATSKPAHFLTSYFKPNEEIKLCQYLRSSFMYLHKCYPIPQK